MPTHRVKDMSLADKGQKRIDRAISEMPVVKILGQELARNHKIFGFKIGACLHVTAETAALVVALRDAGARIALCASNPLSTQDDVAAALAAHHDILVFAEHGETSEEYQE